MKKSSQIQSVDASASAVPERVSVAMAEIAENMSEGLLALAVGAGLQVMQSLMEADVTALAGPKGRHDGARSAVRHGRERGSVPLGGRRVPVTRPRVRAADCGSPEIVEGFLCRFRPDLRFPDLVVDGREPVGSTVASLVIVEGVTPVNDDRLRMDGITEPIAGQHFPFQRGEEHFCGRVIEARPDPAHRLPDPQLAAQPGERVRGVGAAAVGVEDDPLGLLISPDHLAAATRCHGHLDGRARQLGIRVPGSWPPPAAGGYTGRSPSPDTASARTQSGSR